MKKSEKDAIIQKAIELGFKVMNGFCIYDLPFGQNNRLVLSEDSLCLMIKQFVSYNSIRHVESPKDLELLFNAICPEKYRLPFG